VLKNISECGKMTEAVSLRLDGGAGLGADASHSIANWINGTGRPLFVSFTMVNVRVWSSSQDHRFSCREVSWDRLTGRIVLKLQEVNRNLRDHLVGFRPTEKAVTDPDLNFHSGHIANESVRRYEPKNR
jgi:hypothetical protein